MLSTQVTCLFLALVAVNSVYALQTAAYQPDGVAQMVAPLLNTTLVDHEIQLQGNPPKWLIGDYINACPSQFKIGKYEVQNYIDGLFRFNRYRIVEGSKMLFSTKIVDDSNSYKNAMKNKEPQYMLFNFPEPKRMADMIPFIGMRWCSADQCDNIGTMAFLMPDQKTYVMTTDQATMLKFNPDDLSTDGFVDFELGDYQKPTMGATHIVNDITTGDAIGVLGEMKIVKGPPKNYLTFYRIKGDNIKNRVRIGSFESQGMEYYHSFGHTKDYLLMPKNSVTFDVMNMAMGNCVEECFEFHWKTNLEFILMKIEDGTSKTFKVDHPGMVIHTGNTYIEDDILTIDFEMSAKDSSPFKVFSLKWLKDVNRKGLAMGYVFRRYKINLKTEEVTFKDILAPEFNSYGFPMYNPTFQGKKHCFTYITEMFYQVSTTAIVKIDHCNNNRMTRWEEHGVFISEPYFIDNPESQDEDNGLVVVSVFDQKIQKNRFLMIDSHTMKPVSDTELPIRLPMTLHAQFFPKESSIPLETPIFT